MLGDAQPARGRLVSRGAAAAAPSPAHMPYWPAWQRAAFGAAHAWNEELARRAVHTTTVAVHVAAA